MKSSIRTKHLYILVGLITYSFMLGMQGYYAYFLSSGNDNALLDSIYHTLRLFFLEGTQSYGIWQLEVSRFLAPVVTAYSAFVGFIHIFRKAWANTRLRFYRNHIIICGTNERSIELLRVYRSRRKKVVLVDLEQNNPLTEKSVDFGAIFIAKDPVEKSTLSMVRAEYSESILLFLQDDGENLQSLVNLSEYLIKNRPNFPLRCAIHIGNHDFNLIFKEKNIFEKFNEVLDVTSFNIYELTARKLLLDFPLDFMRISNGNKKYVHLVIFGLNEIAESVALHAARSYHYTNNRKTHITFIDADMNILKKGFIDKFKNIEKLCHFNFINGSLFSHDYFSELSKGLDSSDQLTTFVICDPNGQKAVKVAIALKENFARDLPIRIYCPHETGLDILFDEPRFTLFGGLSSCCTPEIIIDENLDTIARAIHDDYLNKCLAQGETIGSRDSLVEWKNLKIDYRNSCRSQADHLSVKMRACGYNIVPDEQGSMLPIKFSKEEIETMSMMEHMRWCADRLLSGWKHGGIRDDARKIHPDLKPWVELNEKTKELDRNAVQNIPELLSVCGLTAERTVDYSE